MNQWIIWIPWIMNQWISSIVKQSLAWIGFKGQCNQLWMSHSSSYVLRKAVRLTQARSKYNYIWGESWVHCANPLHHNNSGSDCSMVPLWPERSWLLCVLFPTLYPSRPLCAPYMLCPQHLVPAGQSAPRLWPLWPQGSVLTTSINVN